MTYHICRYIACNIPITNSERSVSFEIEGRYQLGGVALFIAKYCLNDDVKLAILQNNKIIL